MVSVPNAVYLVINLSTGTLLQPWGGSYTEGTWLSGAARTSAAYQQWKFTYNTTLSAYTIQNVGNGAYASHVQISGPYYGDPVWQTRNSPDYFTLAGGTTPGAYYIFGWESNLLMDLYNSSSEDNTPVVEVTMDLSPSNSDNEQWSLAVVD